MKNLKKLIGAAVVCSIFLSSCTLMTKSMREPNNRVNFAKDDFTYSAQLSAEASSTKILGIDFARLFMKKTGPVLSNRRTATFKRCWKYGITFYNRVFHKHSLQY